MKKVLSLDIGGTNTRAAIYDEGYRLLEVAVRPTPTGSKEAFLENIRRTVSEDLTSLEGVVAIAGGVPGQVRSDGFVYALPNVGINDIPLAEYLSKTFSIPAYIINDAEAAALAEANLGEHKRAKSLFFVTVSTGVGGALTIGGKLRETSYEIGHTVFYRWGEYIEFENYCSGGRIKNLIARLGGTYKNAKELFDGVRNGEEIALVIKKEWVEMMAEWFNMVQKDYQPEVFAITGGVTKSRDMWWDDLKALCPNCNLQLCSFKEEAGLSGGAVLGFQKATE